MPRPRSVPEEEALDRALLLFWEKGYDRTSIADLGQAIGVGPSSLYNAFGSKAELFRRALERYVAVHTGFVPEALAAVDDQGLEDTLRDLLHQAVRLYTTRGLPGGCALLQGGGGGGSTDSEGARIARDFRSELERALRKLFTRASRRAPLADSPRVLSKYVLGVLRGLSQLAADGTARQELLRVADHAVRGCLRPG